ncbi:hypothetical protein K3495_g6568 [Podosphaera aphanis]|nr:hypothetical protein K3495_g6568 [Podosphaera aphanis]
MSGVTAYESRMAWRARQADLLRRGNDMTSTGVGRQRFWKEVSVREVDGSLVVHLDKRPVRRSNSQILAIPRTKPHLATAVAMEWDALISAKQALKHHLIPLTSLCSRALDIGDSDASSHDQGAIRRSICDALIRYLDTDSLLCWAPLPAADPPGYEAHPSRTEPLRVLQQRAAEPILTFLQKHVWPGVQIQPVLDENSILPTPQSPKTREMICTWMQELDAWDLAALERGVLAAKGLLVAARLLVEWSENLLHLRESTKAKSFGVEKAASVASLEVEWQIAMWGAVEDTHDVEREDLRRQLGSVILLSSGSNEVSSIKTRSYERTMDL